MYKQTGTLIKSKFKEHLLPTILTTMALSLATMIDGIIVGQLLGSEALAALGLSFPIIYVINIIYVMFGVGGMICASVARGRLETEKANKLFTMGIVGGVAVMVIFVIITLIALNPISLALANGDTSLAALTRQYIIPLVFTGPALILSNGVSLFMRADGSPKKSAVIVITANAVNLILDYVLIRFLDAGIMGAGLSTTLGYVVGILVVLPYLLNRNHVRSFRFSKIPDILPTAGTVLKAGLPKGCSYIASLGRSLVLNSIVMTVFGAPGMSVMTVLLNVLTLATIFVSGTGDTLLPIVGTLYGERDVFGIRKTVESARTVLIAASVLIMLLFVTCSQLIGGVFGITSDQELSILKVALRMFAAYIPFYATVTTLQNFYNITGRERFAVSIAVMDGFVFICLFAVLLPLIRAEILWLCYAFGSVVTFLVILLIGKLIKRKEHVKGLLLLQETFDQEQVWNLTIDSTAEQAVDLSHQVITFCKNNQVDPTLANRLGVGIEEMAMASAIHAYQTTAGKIDIMIRVNPVSVLIRFRDSGAAFNPMEYQAPESDGVMTDSVAVLKAMADEVSYSSPLGFNITVMTFKRVN